MKTTLCALLYALLMPACLAFDLNSAIHQLGDEDFEVRQAATTAIAKGWHRDSIETLLTLAEKADDPEVASRLRQACRLIYDREVTSMTDRWLELHGKLPFSAEYRYNWLATMRGHSWEKAPGWRSDSLTAAPAFTLAT